MEEPETQAAQAETAVPEVVTETAVPEPAPVCSVLEWRRLKSTPGWLFAGAAAGNRWSTAAEVEPTFTTEADYDAAIERAAGRQ